MAFDEISPIGDWRGDYAAAQISAILAETHRDRKARPKAFTARDFMPFIDHESDTAEISNQVKAALGPLMGKKRKKGK